MLRVVAACILLLAGTVPGQEKKDAPEPWLDALNAAGARLDSNDPHGAIELLEPALASHPTAAVLVLMRGHARRFAGDLVGAAADIDTAMKLAPHWGAVHRERGALRHLRQDLDGALVDLDEAIRLDASDATSWSERGHLRLARQEHGAALSDLDTAISRDPRCASAFACRATVYQVLGDGPRALADHRRATRLGPAYARTWLARAETELRFADPIAARRSIARGTAAARTGDERADLHALDADVHLFTGAVPESLALARQAVAIATSVERRAAVMQMLGCKLVVAGETAAAREVFASMPTGTWVAPWSALMTWHVDAPASRDAADTALRAAFAALDPKLDPTAHLARDACLGERQEARDLEFADRMLPDRCVLWFFAGWRAEVDGRRADATRLMARAVDSGAVEARQWPIARALLRRWSATELRGALGIEVKAAASAQRLDVVAVVPFGAGALQGLRVGDQITSIDDHPATVAAWEAATRDLQVAAPLQLEFVRGRARHRRIVLAGVAVD